MSQYYTKENNFAQEGVLVVEKEEGETLAVLLRRVRAQYGFSDEEKITYAGRLDPAASGLVLFLVGEARFQKEHFLSLHKQYEVEIVFGIETDTLDSLGLITAHSSVPDEKILRDFFAAIPSEIILPIPKYASVPVNGKPLFWHARNQHAVGIPSKKCFFFEKEIVSFSTLSGETIAARSLELVGKVRGDFRQTEIEASWKEFERRHASNTYPLLTLRCTVSSGTYMRAFAAWIGNAVGSTAHAYRIRRIAFLK